jgi:S-adenosylmethionine-diacylgycerolhomoserine-N-methlytransferase
MTAATEPTDAPPVDAADRMDRMYRWTRHVYDATRRYYLLGRDRMLRRLADDLPPAAGTTPAVLEVGCGTARNLRRLADMAPAARLYGLDASDEMLDTARRSLDRGGLPNVTLGQGLAEEVDPPAMLGTSGPFDAVFFSYVLSMIPTWEAAVEAALNQVRPGGTLAVVDFWDQGDLPGWFRTLLQSWLDLFGVHHRPELLTYLRTLDAEGRADLTLEPVAYRYAYIAHLRVPA